MSPCFKALQFICIRVYTLIALLLLGCATFLLSACSSNLPEGAAVPKLEIQKVTFHNQDRNTPYFMIEYVLTHSSTQSLPLLGLNADIYLNGAHAARLDKSFMGQEILVEPNQTIVQRFEVPANLLSQASINSLSNSSLLVLRGTCSLQAIFTTNVNQQVFNPSDSYAGLIHAQKSNTLNNLEQISSRTELSPQASFTPLPVPKKAEEEEATAEQNQSEQATATQATQNKAQSSESNVGTTDTTSNNASQGINPAPKSEQAVAPAQIKGPVSSPSAPQTLELEPEQDTVFGHSAASNQDLLQDFAPATPLNTAPAPVPASAPATVPAPAQNQLWDVPLEQAEPVTAPQVQPRSMEQSQFNQQIAPAQSLQQSVPQSAQQVSRPAPNNGVVFNAQGTAIETVAQ